VATILLINGPNLDLLGQREPETYGVTTLAELESQCADLAAELGVTLECFQSNAEHAIVDRIHEAARNRVNCIVINPAAFTHTSVAIRDALLAVSIPFIELHLSNTHARESFRQHSYFSDIAQGVIAGLGPGGYDLSVRAAARIANSDTKSR
jgi:3-dehydroquinate dehydratase-2